jgi:uncharacterized membrane protein YiaA
MQQSKMFIHVLRLICSAVILLIGLWMYTEHPGGSGYYFIVLGFFFLFTDVYFIRKEKKKP